MFDVKQLVGALMQGGLTGSSSNRIEHALGDRGLEQSGGLLGQGLRGAGGGAGTGSGGLLGDLASKASTMLGGAGQSIKRGDPGALGALGAVAGALLGGGGDAVKGALGGGAMALLGSLALNALLNRGGQGASGVMPPSADVPLGLRAPASASEEQELDLVAELVLQAMISAAKADGEVDDSELQRIGGKLKETGADPEALQFVQRELRKPLDLDGLIRAVPNKQVGAQVYAASLLAVEVDTAAERDYLNRLAEGLGLEPAVTRNIHEALGVA